MQVKIKDLKTKSTLESCRQATAKIYETLMTELATVCLPDILVGSTVIPLVQVSYGTCRIFFRRGFIVYGSS